MLQNGDLVGAYRIDAPLAAGGMGVVYRARHATLGHVVAIKALLPNLALKEIVRLRFAQEAWVQAQLQHPGVARIIDFVQTDAIHAIVMELIEGCSLDHVLAQERPGAWPLDDAMRLLRPIVAAMAYAHARKVVHRDIKPANILMDRRGGAPWPGIPKLTDFGLARLMEATSGMTRAGTRMGTIPYMPPEQFSGRSVDARADVFALGMLARQLVVGALPVDPDDMMAAAELYSGMTPLPSVGEVVPGLPGPFVQAIDTALSLDPDQRPPTAEAFYAALGFGALQLGGGSSIETQAPSAWGADAPKQPADSIDLQLPKPTHEPATAPTEGSLPANADNDLDLSEPVSGAASPEQLPDPSAQLAPQPSVQSAESSGPPASHAEAPVPPTSSAPPTRAIAFGVALGLVGAIGGALAYISAEAMRVQEAEEQALLVEQARLLQTAWTSLERFKTDREANRQTELVDAALSASASAVALRPTPEALGLHALSTVWAHKWHYGSTRWDGPRYAADLALTQAATAEPTPAGLLAHALLQGTGCALMPDSHADRAATCAAVEPAYEAALSTLNSDAPQWLAFEGSWTYAYVLNQAASHDWLEGRADEASLHWRAVHAHCKESWAGIPTGLVNAPELMEECAEAAGALKEYGLLLESVDWLRDHAYSEDWGVPFKAFAAAYRSAHPVCQGLDLEAHKRYGKLVPDLARDDTERFFCYAAGLLFLDCPALFPEAAAEGRARAPAMPWAEVEASWKRERAARPSSRRMCALTGKRDAVQASDPFGSSRAQAQRTSGCSHVVTNTSREREPWLTLRKSADASSKDLAHLPDGTCLRSLRSTRKGRSTWLQVEVKSGIFAGWRGWVHSRWTRRS